MPDEAATGSTAEAKAYHHAGALDLAEIVLKRLGRPATAASCSNAAAYLRSLSRPPAAQNGWRDIATGTGRERFRVGRKVPRHVYEGDRPFFAAATEEDAARFVALLNSAPPSPSEKDPSR